MSIFERGASRMIDALVRVFRGHGAMSAPTAPSGASSLTASERPASSRTDRRLACGRRQRDTASPLRRNARRRARPAPGARSCRALPVWPDAMMSISRLSAPPTRAAGGDLGESSLPPHRALRVGPGRDVHGGAERPVPERPAGSDRPGRGRRADDGAAGWPCVAAHARPSCFMKVTRSYMRFSSTICSLSHWATV